MSDDCLSAARSLASGEAADPAHLATCSSCRARASLVAVLASAAAPLPRDRPPRPDPRVLERDRVRRKLGWFALELAVVAILLVLCAPPIVLRSSIDSRLLPVTGTDLLAVADPDPVLDVAQPLPEEALLALLDLDADPLSLADPLEDALLGTE